MGRNIFITGASGFLGRNRLKSLAERFPDDVFYVLARSDSTKRELREIFAGIEPDRLRVVGGDITEELPIVDAREIIHMAASTSFDDKEKDEIRNTNVNGTRNVLEVARRMKNLENFYFVSTAYVAGNSHGLIPEDELPPANNFRNAYEASKWEAEKLVRTFGIPFTILRPSIILGDSRTRDSQGERRMMYGYLLGIYYAVKRYFRNKGIKFDESWKKGKELEISGGLRLIGKDTTRKDFVCIDDVVESMERISSLQPIGRTFNLTSDYDLTGAEIGPAIEHALRIKGISYAGEEIPNPTDLERAIMDYTTAFVPYTIISDPRWITNNTHSFLRLYESANPTSEKYQRVKMTPELFSSMLYKFMEREVMGVRNGTKV